MLDRARQKAGDLPITWVEADARDYAGCRFGLIFELVATFQHMLTRADQLAFLACAVNTVRRPVCCGALMPMADLNDE